MKIKINTIKQLKEFHEAAIRCQSDIDVGIGRYIVDAKSMMALLSLNLLEPLDLTIIEHRPCEADYFIHTIRKLGVLIDGNTEYEQIQDENS